LDIAITPPEGTFVQIFSRSGLSVKNHIDVTAGTIDRDYTGNVVMVSLHNSSQQDYTVNTGDRIAQIIVINHQTPEILQATDLTDTDRGCQGFGSTGVSEKLGDNVPSIYNLDQAASPTTNTVMLDPDISALRDGFYDLYCSHDPFDNTVEIPIPIKGDHPVLGMQFQYCDFRQRLQLKDMALSTPGSRIPKWRSVLRNACLLKFNEFSIQSPEDLDHAIRQVRLRKLIKATMVFATDKATVSTQWTASCKYILIK